MKEYLKAKSTGVTVVQPIDELVSPYVVDDLWFKTIEEATVLTAADNGKICFLNAAAGAAITLPALAADLTFKFIVGAAFATTNWTVVSASSANIIQGGAIVNSTFVPAGNEDTISFVASAETLGDYVDVVCDGVNWYVSGVGAAAGSITFTVAS